MKQNKFFLTLIVGLLMASCSPREDEKSPSGEQPNAMVFAVNVIPASRGQIQDYLLVGGEVGASSAIDVFADTAGRLLSLSVAVGQEVRANQVVAEVDPSRPGMNFVPSPVRSPISGTVLQIPLSQGATVGPSTPILRVGQIEDLEITSRISERFVSRLEVGQRAILRFIGFPGETWEARVREISPVLDPVSRTVSLKLKMVEPDPRIKAGMFPEIQLITQSKENTVKIPQEAVIRRFGETFVFVVKETQEEEEMITRAEKRLVVPGITIDDKVEILSGLEAQEKVVVRGQSLLEDAAPVRIILTLEPLGSVHLE